MAILAGQMAMGSATKDGGLLNQLIKLIIMVVVLCLVLLLAYAIFLVWQNWDAIAVWGTTGFIGWLNPFDSDEGDTGPLETAGNEAAKISGIPGWLIPIVPFIISPVFGVWNLF